MAGSLTMATILQVLLGIETRLKTIDGLNVEEYSPGQINPPQAIVGVPPIEKYQQAMARRLDFSPTVTVFVSSAMDRAAQLLLAEYADTTGARSIPAAIEADRTLGGIGDCTVTGFQPLGLVEYGQLQYPAGLFTLRVLA